VTRIAYTAIPEWPPLAWLARCRPGHEAVDVFHGARVEVAAEWFVEAVWAGRYSDTAFDRTDLVFGSGGRLRNGTLTFVSAGTTVDRLQWLQRGETTWISNSMPCLLMAAEGVPDPTFPGYYDAFKSIMRGIRSYEREIHTSAGPARLVYFDNLEWNGTALRAVEKPAPQRDFSSFEKYRDFLQATLRVLNENLLATERRFPYRWLGTISSGYDSLTTAVLAKPFGLDEVISFTEARGGEADSGEAAASLLGLRLSLIDRDAWQLTSRPEVPFVASDAKGEDVFFRGAEGKLEGRVLLSGFHGGTAWDRDSEPAADDIVRGDQSGLSLTEFRLWAGFLHCPIAFAGARQARDISTLSRSAEMRQWDVGGRYTRPISRRIIETAGIPRGTFAVRKRAGSVLFFQHDGFLSPTSHEDLTQWLRSQEDEWRKRGLMPPTAERPRKTIQQRGAAIVAPIIQGLARATGNRFWPLNVVGRRLMNIAYPQPLFRYLFPWAIARAKERYATGLRGVSTWQPSDPGTDARQR
jgi:hypothetical protein